MLSATRSSGDDDPASSAAPIVVWRRMAASSSGVRAPGLRRISSGTPILPTSCSRLACSMRLGLGRRQAEPPARACRTAGSCARGARRCRSSRCSAARLRRSQRPRAASRRSSMRALRDLALQLGAVGRAPGGAGGPRARSRARTSPACRARAPTSGADDRHDEAVLERELRRRARRAPRRASAARDRERRPRDEAQQRHGETEQRDRDERDPAGGASRSGLPCMAVQIAFAWTSAPAMVSSPLVGGRVAVLQARSGRAHRRRPSRAAARGGTRPATTSANDTVGIVPGRRGSRSRVAGVERRRGQRRAGGAPGRDDGDAVQPLDARRVVADDVAAIGREVRRGGAAVDLGQQLVAAEDARAALVVARARREVAPPARPIAS